MFRELIAAWRKTDPLKEMFQSLISMIEAARWMFEKAWGCAVEGKVPPEVKDGIYRRDIEVNRTERSIRRRIVEHLSVQPGVDVPACLVLMSVVKDAERVGDYCKNIMETTELMKKPLAECPFFESFDQIRKEVQGLFTKTIDALANSNDVLAQDAIVEERNIGVRCESLIERLAGEEMPSKYGVPWALTARYMKRVAGHLSNIASGIVMPLHKLDYYDEKYLKPRQDAKK